MTLHHRTEQQKLGLAATERRLTEIALLMRNVFPNLSWERQTLYRSHRNNLKIEFDRKRVVVPFSNRELRSHSRTLRVRALDHRMYAAIGTLFEA